MALNRPAAVFYRKIDNPPMYAGETFKAVFNQRGIGFFVQGDAIDVIRQTERRKFIEEELPLFRGRAALLGINLKEFID